jgi:hypothetical protein
VSTPTPPPKNPGKLPKEVKTFPFTATGELCTEPDNRIRVTVGHHYCKIADCIGKVNSRPLFIGNTLLGTADLLVVSVAGNQSSANVVLVRTNNRPILHDACEFPPALVDALNSYPEP